MIVQPFNDHECLLPASQVSAKMAADQDPALVEFARRCGTIDGLIAAFRSMGQRDDLSDPKDGPRLKQCSPTQRLRVGADLLYPEDGSKPLPNCFERTVNFNAAAQLIDPSRTYQMATVETPFGMHTFPVMDGRPVCLDPIVSQEALECGMALESPGPIGVVARNALAWTIDLAKQEVRQLRNGAVPVLQGESALVRFVDHGKLPTPEDRDAMGILFALADRAARRYGTRALGIVRTALRAISSLIDAVLANRNARFNIGGLHFDTPKALDDVAGAVGSVGLNLGSAILRHELDGMNLAGMLGLPGGTAAVVGLLESELGKRGRTLGAFAHPPEMVTFAKFAKPTTG